MPNQDTYGRLTPSAWNLIKNVKLTEEEQDRLKLLIEAKTETITYDEAKVILYDVMRGNWNITEQKVNTQISVKWGF